MTRGAATGRDVDAETTATGRDVDAETTADAREGAKLAIVELI